MSRSTKSVKLTFSSNESCKRVENTRSFQRYRKINLMTGKDIIHGRFEGVNRELRNYKRFREKL